MRLPPNKLPFNSRQSDRVPLRFLPEAEGKVQVVVGDDSAGRRRPQVFQRQGRRMEDDRRR